MIFFLVKKKHHVKIVIKIIYDTYNISNLNLLWFQLGGRGGGRVVHAEHHKFMSFDIKNINEVISFRIHLCKKKKKNQIFEV